MPRLEAASPRTDERSRRRRDPLVSFEHEGEAALIFHERETPFLTCLICLEEDENVQCVCACRGNNGYHLHCLGQSIIHGVGSLASDSRVMRCRICTAAFSVEASMCVLNMLAAKASEQRRHREAATLYRRALDVGTHMVALTGRARAAQRTWLNNVHRRWRAERRAACMHLFVHIVVAMGIVWVMVKLAERFGWASFFSLLLAP